MTEGDFLITARDLESKGFCVKGQRKWARENAMDFAAFLKEGIMASRLVETGDGMAIRAVELLRADRG